MKHLRLLAFVSLMGLAISASADILGTWKGSLKLIMPKGATIPKDKQEQAKKDMAILAKTRMTVTFKADHTYASTLTNGPDGKNHTAEGKWDQKGDTVTTTPTKRDGKTPTGEGAKTQTMKLTNGGKKLVRSFPGGITVELTKG